MMNLLRSEPVACGAFLSAVLAFVSLRWLHFSTNEMAAALLVINTFVALFVRQNVLSPATLHQAGYRMSEIVDQATENRKAGIPPVSPKTVEPDPVNPADGDNL